MLPRLQMKPGQETVTSHLPSRPLSLHFIRVNAISQNPHRDFQALTPWISSPPIPAASTGCGTAGMEMQQGYHKWLTSESVILFPVPFLSICVSVLASCPPQASTGCLSTAAPSILRPLSPA